MSHGSRRLITVALLLTAFPASPALHAQDTQVGYGVLTPTAGGRLPVGAALFTFRFGGVLVSESGVPAVEPISRGRIFIDQTSTLTGLALANASNLAVTIDFMLRDAAGRSAGTRTLQLEARQHLALYANDSRLFPGISPTFVGSVTFEARGSGQVAAVTLRQSFNAQQAPIFSTLPVVDLDQPANNAASIIFPHLGAGGGLSTQLILINPGSGRISGRIRIFGTDGNPLTLRLDGVRGSDFPYEVAPDGTFQASLTNEGDALGGYAVLTVDQGEAPAGTALFQFRDPAGPLDSEAGVGAIPSTTAARIFVDTDRTDTGVAIANPGNSTARITFELLDRNGLSIRTTQRDIPARGQLAIFVTQLFSGLPAGFTGLLEIRSNTAVVPITLKFTVNSLSNPILTTLPIADLTRLSNASLLVFPQVGFGSGLTTRLILINADTRTRIRGELTFTQSNGNPLVVPLAGESGSRFDFDLSAGSGRQLRPGDSADVSEIRLDLGNPFLSEFHVSMGDMAVIRPVVVDTNGNPRDDFEFTFNSLDGNVATVDSLGRVRGLQPGFSTLTVSTQGRVLTGTLAVEEVDAGVPGFQPTGLAQDSARRIYLTESSLHTILLAANIQQTPERWAGVTQTPGYRDAERLQALFRRPTFIALNQRNGNLYVSDSENHVIRVVGRGGVETLTGRNGQPGSSDGALAQARFNNPQGLALDDRGDLWVVDSGNHAIRRVNLRDGTVATVAGLAGSAGLSDGRGAAARFRSPVGVAVEFESPARQQARQLTGEPPPPVSVVVSDTGNNQLRRVLEDGTVTTIGAAPANLRAGTADLQAAAQPFSAPRGVAVDSIGNIYVTETDSGQARVLLRSGGVAPVGQEGTFSAPQGVVVTGAGQVVIADGLNLGREITYGAPSIDSVSPSAISVNGGTAITIRGRNFSPDSLVVIGPVLLDNFDVLDTGRIRFVAPPGLPSGEMTVTVQTRGGLAQTSLRINPIAVNALRAGDVTTVAGGSTYAGDGLPAAVAPLTLPSGTAVDGAGNLFVADTFNNRIRRIDAVTGIVTTVAGTGRLGFFGDGQLAVTAELAFPIGIAVDAMGNLYIADTFNLRIRRVDLRTGIITTVAGDGFQGFSGDGGPAVEASFSVPLGLAVDSAGDLYIADSGFEEGDFSNNRIRRVDVRTGVITTAAGNGTAGFSGDGGQASQASLNYPAGIAFDLEDNLYVADVFNHRVRRIATNGVISTVAGNGTAGFSGDGGAATSARLNEPSTVAVDIAGNLFIVDSVNQRVRRVDSATRRISTYAGNGSTGFSGDGGPATQASFNSPVGVSADAGGNVFVADTFNHRVRRIDAVTGRIAAIAGNGQGGPIGDNGPAIYAAFGIPLGLALDPDDDLIVSDYLSSTIRRATPGGTIRRLAGTGDIGFFGENSSALNASLQLPYGVAVDELGNVYFADQSNHRIRRVDAFTGRITTVAGNGQQGFSGDFGPALDASLDNPTRVVLDGGSGNLFINDSGNLRIRLVSLLDGTIRTVAGNGEFDELCLVNPPEEEVPATATPMGAPDDLAVDLAGNLVLADFCYNRVRRVNKANGLIETIAGNIQGAGQLGVDDPAGQTPTLFFPFGVEFDGAGNLFITDLFQILRVDGATGVGSKVAGAGFGFAGDGGSAANAFLFFPRDLAISDDGTIYVADSVNGRIRAIPGAAARVQTLFFDDIESGGANWLTFSNFDQFWVLSEDDAYSPTTSLFAEDAPFTSDQILEMADEIQLPANATFIRLSFWHRFGFEEGLEPGEGFDGGVVEISVDGGFTWDDAGPLFIANSYNGTIDSSFGNPLGDRPAFTGRPAEIFLRSDLDLTPLRGQRILVRFVVGTDSSEGDEGWYIDNVRVEAAFN